MNRDIAESVKVIKVINRHLDEPHCNHNIKYIMTEALEKSAGVYETPAAQTTDADIHEGPVRYDYRDRSSK